MPLSSRGLLVMTLMEKTTGRASLVPNVAMEVVLQTAVTLARAAAPETRVRPASTRTSSRGVNQARRTDRPAAPGFQMS